MPRYARTALILAVAAASASAAGAQIGDTPAQLWEQVSAGISLPEQEDAYFGLALAAGDFDGDGFEDLAVGIPEYDLTDATDAGLVLVMYGDWAGPQASGHDLWTQDNVLLADDGEEDDRFGSALVAGNFNGDAYDDLAIGIPYETVDGEFAAGAVHVLYGSAVGLSTVDDQFLHQGAGGGAVAGTPEEYDRFGFTLAVGDFDGDGIDDLAVGAPYEEISAQVGAGAFHALFLSASGLSTANDKLFYLGNNMPRTPAEDENLAWSLAAGNFDTHVAGDELAVGAPGTALGELLQAGTVWLLSDLDGTTSATPIDLDDAGMPDDAQFGDFFGCALAAGQFDGVGVDDLAMTACRRTVDSQSDAGRIYVHYGGALPVAAIDQDGLPDEAPEAGDFFGSVLASGDFDADGVDDLAIGVYFEGVGAAGSAGVVHLLPGINGQGLTKVGAQTLTQQVDAPDAGDRFGQALAVGRLSGHSGDDLAVGAPWESDGPMDWIGAANVFFSDALFLDDFEGGDLSAWSAAAGVF